MEIRYSSSLRRKIFKYKILLNPKLQETKKCHKNTAIKHTLQYSHNNSTGSSIPKSSVSEEKEMKIDWTVNKQEFSNGNT
jgi:hypothetical protein